MHHAVLFSSLSCVVVAGSFTLQAQDAPSLGAPLWAISATGQTDGDLSTPRLKVTTDLVNVYLSVSDKSGYIKNIQKGGCAIEEDRVPQKIKDFTFEDNLPLSIGLLLDTSSSQRRVMPFEREAAGLFLNHLAMPKDETFLISFDSNVDLLADFSNEPAFIQQAIDHAAFKAGASPAGKSLSGNRALGGDLLYDALYLAVHDELQQAAGRRVLLVVTDGNDEGSQNTLKSATAAVQKGDTIVYVVLTTDKSSADRRQAYRAMVEMDRLARSTGGRVIDVGTDQRKLDTAFTQIEHELQAQYLASYTSTNDRMNLPFRQLRVKCGKGEKVQVQKAYYVLTDESGDE